MDFTFTLTLKLVLKPLMRKMAWNCRVRVKKLKSYTLGKDFEMAINCRLKHSSGVGECSWKFEPFKDVRTKPFKALKHLQILPFKEFEYHIRLNFNRTYRTLFYVATFSVASHMTGWEFVFRNMGKNRVF